MSFYMGSQSPNFLFNQVSTPESIPWPILALPSSQETHFPLWEPLWLPWVV